MPETETETGVFAHPAAVVLRANQSEILSEALSHRALTEDFVRKYTPFFFSAEISNTRLDSHYTRMGVSSLKNYAEDAQSGVSFLHSHNREEILGRSISGKFVGGQGNGVSRVIADFYTIPGLQLGSVSSDQLIRGIDSGILADVSIGFHGGEWICGICGRDLMRDWDCYHIPGYMAEVEGDGQVKEEICTADVENARLSETSDVFDGSTPGAAIIKAQQEAEAGRITPEAKRIIETRYRIHLPGKRVAVPGHKSFEETSAMIERRETAEGGTPAPAADSGAESSGAEGAATTNTPASDVVATEAAAAAAATEAAVTSAAASSAQAGSVETETEEAAAAAAAVIVPEETERHISKLRGVVGDSVEGKAAISYLRGMGSECTRLRALADEGRAYRSDLIEETLREGVRAQGQQFPAESFRAMLGKASITEIKSTRESFKAVGNSHFQGGRQTSDEASATPPLTTEAVEVPADMFRG